MLGFDLVMYTIVSRSSNASSELRSASLSLKENLDIDFKELWISLKNLETKTYRAKAK